MINKLCNKIGQVSKDKLLHYFISYIIYDICLSVFASVGTPCLINIIGSFIMISIVIVGKELLDEKQYGGWCWYDILAGYLGVITKLILFLITT